MGGTLVVQTGYLGDLILTLPLVRALHDRGDEGSVALLVRSGFAELARSQGYVGEVLELDKSTSGLARLREDLRIMRALRRRRYKTVYGAHRSVRSRSLVRATGAVERIGYLGRAAGWAYTESIRFNYGQHAVDRFLALAGLQGAASKGSSWFITPPDAAAQARELLVRSNTDLARPYAVIAPGSVWPTKRWNEHGFSKLIDQISADGVQTLLVGNEAEVALTARIAAGATCCSAVIDLAGKTDLLQLSAILKQASYVVGNDSGVGHLAAAVGTPIVTIFGPTATEHGFTPWTAAREVAELESLDCRPCSRHGSTACPLGHHDCMKRLNSDQVFASIERLKLSLSRPEGPPQ
jgi:heptosyltransferase-2